MAEVSGRRANQFGDFVFHLELAAIHFENVLLAAVQHIGQRFDGLGFAGAGGPEQQKHADRAAFGRKTGLKHLDVGNNHSRGGRLAHNLLG